MAWSWSHTRDAMDAAERNVHRLPKETLEIVFAEWRAAQVKSGRVVANEFNDRKYHRALAHAKELTQ